MIKLTRLTDSLDKMPPELFRRYYNDSMSAIETTLNAVLAIPEIQAALIAAQAAIDAANTAISDVNTAVGTANTAIAGINTTVANTNTDLSSARSEASLVNSYPANYTAPLISADAAGNVTIANHDRFYGDPTLNPTVHVTGGVVSSSGISGDNIRIYYNDSSRAGGAVTYHFTIDPADPPVQGGNTHSVGAVTIPASGTSSGVGVKPPGWVDP